MTNTICTSPAHQSHARLQPWVLPADTTTHASTSAKLEGLLHGFDPITLEEMDSVSLLNRVDTKYIIPIGKLPSILGLLLEDYRILVVKGQRFNHYRTLYFDTPQFDLFNMHVNGRADRYKVRSREYVDTHLSFLEVKHKTRKERTIKQRLSTDHPMLYVEQEAKKWLEHVYPYAPHGLEPKIWNTFSRITLVRLEHNERVTLDLDITFFNANRVARLDGIAIAEVKLDAQDRTSPFIAQMREKRLRPQGFSKYCMGTSMLYEQVKSNALKQRILWLEKISREQ